MTDTTEKTILESVFDDFNSLMDKYNEEITSTDDQKEKEDIQKKYDKLIEQQEATLEAAVEQDFKESQEVLQEEEDAFYIDPEIKFESLTPKDEEIKFLIENATDADFIAKRYNSKNDKRNGFSTITIASFFDVPTQYEDGKWKSEKILSEEIFMKIEEIRIE